MDAETRASAVRKLRELADLLEAGKDAGAVFYADDGDGCRGWVDAYLSARKAKSNAEAGLNSHRTSASGDGWGDPAEIEPIGWGIMLPLEVARIVSRREAPACEEHGERWDYGLVDPDGYTLPDLLPPDCDCEVCEPEEDAP